MTSSEPLELLEELKEGADEYKHAILGSFTFEPSFFEQRLLPILQQKDAGNILLLLDKKEYDDKFLQMKLAGREYYVDYCICRETFHPKFLLLVWEGGAKLFLGSANINEYAWMRSGELVTNLEYEANSKDIASTSILLDMKDFLHRLMEKGLLKSNKHRQKLEQCLAELDWLKKGEQVRNDRAQLIHNLDEPILTQVLRVIGDEKILQAHILSPFFNLDGTILQELLKINCQQINLYVQPDKVVSFPQQFVLNSGKSIKTFSIHFREQENRYIHAKILILKTSTRSYCLSGSANATRSALLSTADNGNIELCLLRSEDKLSYFDYLLDSKIFEIKEVMPDLITVRSIKDSSKKETYTIKLLDARLEGRILILEIDSNDELANPQIKLWHHDVTEPKIYAVELQDNNTLRIHLDEEGYSFCSKPTFVTVETEFDSQIIQSDRRWISTEALEKIPRRRNLEQIQKSLGRFGFISLLNQLYDLSESMDWLLYYLQWIRFDKLKESLEDLRTGALKKRKSIEDDEEGELTFEDHPTLSAKQVFTKMTERNRKYLENKIQIQDVSKNPREALEIILNLFLGTSKLTLWFVLRYQNMIEELSRIVSDMEKMTKFITELRGECGSPKIELIVNELKVWEHMMVLCFLINNEHKKSGYAIKPINARVMEVFRQTYSDVLRSWGKQKFEDCLNSFGEVIKEYQEFEKLALHPDDVVRFCEEICYISKTRNNL